MTLEITAIYYPYIPIAITNLGTVYILKDAKTVPTPYIWFIISTSNKGH